jgi:hypothetical protein
MFQTIVIDSLKTHVLSLVATSPLCLIYNEIKGTVSQNTTVIFEGDLVEGF